MFRTLRSKETCQIAVVTSQINGDNVDNVRHFRNKKREYLKDRINELATHSKNKNVKRPV
jgi:hypothetical protein